MLIRAIRFGAYTLAISAAMAAGSAFAQGFGGHGFGGPGFGGHEGPGHEHGFDGGHGYGWEHDHDDWDSYRADEWHGGGPGRFGGRDFDHDGDIDVDDAPHFHGFAGGVGGPIGGPGVGGRAIGGPAVGARAIGGPVGGGAGGPVGGGAPGIQGPTGGAPAGGGAPGIQGPAGGAAPGGAVGQPGFASNNRQQVQQVARGQVQQGQQIQGQQGQVAARNVNVGNARVVANNQQQRVAAPQQVAKAAVAAPQQVAKAAVAAPKAAPVAAAQAAPTQVAAAAPAAAAADAAPAILVEANALLGQWQASNKDIAGRESVMQLTVDNDGQATLRIQTRGQEPFELKLPYTLEKNVLTLGDGDQKMTMGEIASTTDDKIVFKRDNATITFSKI